MKSTSFPRLIRTGSLLAIALICGATAKATETLVITEYSSTSLTASYDGNSLTVLNSGPDLWFIQTPNLFLTPATVQWTEPEDPSKVNIVNTGNESRDFQIPVFSDAPSFDSPANPNGFTDTTDFTIVLSNGLVPLDVTFNDLGDSARSVPDATATLPLLGFAAAGLGIFSKWNRKQRTARSVS